jgi:hypothetical protein
MSWICDVAERLLSALSNQRMPNRAGAVAETISGKYMTLAVKDSMSAGGRKPAKYVLGLGKIPRYGVCINLMENIRKRVRSPGRI